MLMEDVDAVFAKREAKEKVSFSALLNCLDGIFYREGIITILTTNHPENLDSALTRDGRVDMQVEFTNPQEKEVKEYVSLFYGTEMNGEIYKGSDSMAAIQNLCLKNDELSLKEKLFTTNK
jgi:chaperone BCS1